MPSLILQTLNSLGDKIRNYTHTSTLLVVASLCLLYFSWRFYRFHLLPRRHPEDAREVPYWIPFIGHALPFFRNSYCFLVRARESVGYDGSPFAFTVFGTKFYVITQARHAAEVDKNLETLSFDEFIQVFLRTGGLSEQAIRACYIDKLPSMIAGIPNPSGGNMGDISRLMHIHQLHPGDKQQAVEARFLRAFDRLLRLEEIPCEEMNSTSLEVSLYQWCGSFFTRSGEFAYFGNTLASIDPDFAKMFYIFDELSWQLTYQIPEFLAKKKRDAQQHLHRSLKRYFQIPQNQREKTVWFTTAAENALREIGINDHDLATLFLMIYLTINTNTRRATFWMLTHLLLNPSLLEAVRQETAMAFEGDDLVNPEHLYSHDLCPQLEAVWLETLRVSSTGSSVRCVNKDTMVGGKLLRKGNKIMMPFRLLHLDEKVYWEDARLFKHERFMNKDNRARGGNWRPFGGGKTICAGRFVAEHMIKSCVAMTLRRFDLQVPAGASLPQGDEGTPGLGIMGLVKGQDFRVRVSARAK